jgi:hypothetical protein
MPRLAAAAAATVLGLLGCGPASVSHGEFLRRGNAVCAASATRIAQLAAPGPPGGPSADRMAGYVDAYVAELRQELANLRLIGYPPGERRRLGRAYDALGSALTAIERDPLSFRAASLVAATRQLRASGLGACRP